MGIGIVMVVDRHFPDSRHCRCLKISLQEMRRVGWLGLVVLPFVLQGGAYRLVPSFKSGGLMLTLAGWANSYSGVNVSFLWREIELQVTAVLARHMPLFSRVIYRSDNL